MKKVLLFVTLIFVLMIGMMSSALAEGGNGDGSGGGSSEPLRLETSSVPNGGTDVALDVIITLTFSKNVVNMAVRDNNMTCFSLADAAGGVVRMNILMGDDQVDPSVKNTVTIKPSKLSPDTTYTLTISKNLTSKSGVTLGQDTVLTFKTVGSTAPSPSPSPAAPPSSSANPAPTASFSPTPSSPPSPSAAITEPSESASAAPSPSEAGTTSNSVPSAPPSGTTAASPSGGAQVSSTPAVSPMPDSAGQPSPVLWFVAGGAVLAIAAVVVLISIRKRK